MTLQELEQKEKELWKIMSETDERMKPIRQEWSVLLKLIEKAKLREEVLSEMITNSPAQPLTAKSLGAMLRPE
jgi:hypothetical protein